MRYFFRYPTASEPSLYQDGEYVYACGSAECQYFVDDGYWYKFPTGVEAQFWEDDGMIYKFPTATTPTYYTT